MIDNKKRVIIAAGGTGGHVFPGLVIANALQKLGVEVVWVGTKYGIEAKLLPDYPLVFYTIPIRGIRGSFLAKLLLPFRLIVSILKSIKIISHYQVCGILGMGGYPAFPVDTHIHRLAQRWGLTKGKNVIETEKDLKKLFPKNSWNKLHLQIIYYGRSHCTARGCDGTVCEMCKTCYPNRKNPFKANKA